MNPYYKLISLTFVLLFSSILFAHRIHPLEQYHAKYPESKSMLILPTESDISWWEYLPSPRHQIFDRKNYFFSIRVEFN